MLIVAIVTALGLLAALVVVVTRALAFIRTHPELTSDTAPISYLRCRETFALVVARYRELEGGASLPPRLVWTAPNGARCTVDGSGVTEQRAGDRAGYFLPWSAIGGVGLRMQPAFRASENERDGRASTLHTAGYTFHLLIVPASGATIDIPIPLGGEPDTIAFVAGTLARARRMHKRINTFGFDRPPAPPHQRVTDW